MYKPDNQNAQYENQPLGVKNRPYPMMVKQQEWDGRTTYELGVLEDSLHPLNVYSQRDYAEVVGIAMRDMPTPSMLRLFQEGMHLREKRIDEHGNIASGRKRFEYILGEHGSGKSFMAHLHAKMRDPRGAILIDCGGKDLSELFSKTVLDHAEGKAVYDKIDERLANGTLKPATYNALKDLLGDAFIESEGEQAVIDWQRVSPRHVSIQKHEETSNQIMQSLGLTDDALRDLAEDDPLREQYNARMEQAIANLSHSDNEFCSKLLAITELEGLRELGGGIGLKQVEGDLITAFKQDRAIILDEYNKMKQGTDDRLQVFWQFMKGEEDQYVADIGGGQTFTFRREDMGPNFFATLTGNRTTDGYSTRALSDSANDRLDPRYISAPTVDDLQHRLCQKLTGLPISTIYNANKPAWDKLENSNPGAFAETMLTYLKAGRTEGQLANIPSWQIEMLKNWQNVIQATEQIATFIDTWAQSVDPNSEFHKKATELNSNLSPEEQADHEQRLRIREEISTAYRGEASIGMRLMMSMVDKATQIHGKAIEADQSEGYSLAENLLERPDIPLAVSEEIERQFGTRFAEIIAQTVADKCDGREDLQKWLNSQAGLQGIIPMDTNGHGKTNEDYLISSLLNIEPHLQINEIEGLHELCDVVGEHVAETLIAQLEQEISELDPTDANYQEQLDELTDTIEGIKSMDSPAQLVDSEKLNKVLQNAGKQKEIEREALRSGVMHLPNTFFDENQNQGSPLRPATGISMSHVASSEEELKWFKDEHKAAYQTIVDEETGLEQRAQWPAEVFADAKELLVSFALPFIGQQNIRSVWNEYLDVTSGTDSMHNKILNNNADNGLALQLVKCRTTDEHGEAQEEYLYVMHNAYANQGKGQTLVTGTLEISQKLQNALARNGVTYINRTHPDASVRIEEIFDQLLEGKDTTYIDKQHEHSLEQALLQASNILCPIKNENGISKLPYPYLLEADYLTLQTDSDGRSPLKKEEKQAIIDDHDNAPKNDNGTNQNPTKRPAADVAPQAKANLISILADEHAYLAEYGAAPYYVTNSPNLGELRNTVRALMENDPGQGRQAAAG